VYPRDDRQLSELLEETHVLSRLVEDLRTLALSDAGVLPLQKEATDLTHLVHEAVRSMSTEANRRSVSVVVTPFAETPIVELDPVRIREVLTNLLSNAVRHSDPGGSVTVSLRLSNGDVAVIVHDTGAGMSPEEVGRMFDRFYKGSNSRGSGLGLAIAKSIITAHGGEIRASSELGSGTTVEFTVPR
jgi:signal transduction histidine kinase